VEDEVTENDDKAAGDRVAEVWREQHVHLTDLAFGMLGDIGRAEDAVQDAFTRLSSADFDAIDDMRGWLTVVTSRICLDQIRSARARRERPTEPASLEPAGTLLAPRPTVDPADRVTLDDEIRLALLVVLQQLRPAERVAFVLHDVFQLPFESVAATMGRTVAGCRQLAKRARDKVQAAHVTSPAEVPGHQLVVQRFIEACSNGSLESLLPLLDPDVWGDVDLGPGDERTGRTARGARAVAANLLRYFGNGPTLVSHPGMPGTVVLAFSGDRLLGVIAFSVVRHGRIAKIHVIADPAKTAFIDAELIRSQ
jgi:RNA polymerase sigma-70 factor (ECF subfamily)